MTMSTHLIRSNHMVRVKWAMGGWRHKSPGKGCGENLLRLPCLCSTQIVVGQAAAQRTTLTPALVEVNR
jgi:hypothetical protein